MKSRRTFLKALPVAAATAALTQPLKNHARAAAGERLRIAMIGTGGMGMNHVRTLCQRQDVEFAWVIDADISRAQAAAKIIQESLGQAPKVGQDLRAAVDDSSVRACFMATPDHWHAPGTILAADAGKPVYVEKPCSHNLREGRLMIEAATRNGVPIQVGTQSRSTPHVREVVEKIRGGIIGEVLVAKAWNSQKRADHGKQPPSDPPAELDYEAWLGPVPAVPFKRTYHPAHWRWFYHFGAGDIGNDGVHDIDIARWGLGVETHPDRIQAMGEKLFFADDQEWPDTLYCTFGYTLPDGKKRQLIYEQRIWSPYMQEGEENGCAWYGTEGMIVGSKRSGWRIFGPKNQAVSEISANGVDLAAHHDNFIRSVRGEANAPLHAGIDTNHYSSALCHLANIAVRTGRTLSFLPPDERFKDDPEADKLLSRAYRDHWAAPKGV
ncbi:MAG: Gfo/Idh/MocA family oxidoreductase [Verrucomicrobiales bacterium]|nr:Gfo/Idh/MocA family oxidoreductase [Verrucomicrobiales bacterium]